MTHFHPYIVSLVVGLGIGVIYGLVSVRSPAPPIIALLGLLGMLAGEAGVQWLKGHASAVQSVLREKTFASVMGVVKSTIWFPSKYMDLTCIGR